MISSYIIALCLVEREIKGPWGDSRVQSETWIFAAGDEVKSTMYNLIRGQTWRVADLIVASRIYYMYVLCLDDYSYDKHGRVPNFPA